MVWSRTSAKDKAVAAEQALFHIGVGEFNREGPPAALPREAKAEDVPIVRSDGGTGHIHAVWVPQEHHPASLALAAQQDTPLVLLHGYMSGAGVYYSSLARIAHAHRGPVIAIDSLGCGLSSRPKWCTAIRSSRRGKDQASQVEDFFVGGVEAFRAALGVEKMIVLGHSLGGYAAVAYAERHPTRVERLVLAGCAGIPEKGADEPAWHAESGVFTRMLAHSAEFLWRRGLNPLTLNKSWLLSGTVKKTMDRRLHRAAERGGQAELDALVHYFRAQWGSGNVSVGGYAHSAILNPDVYAKKPLWGRFPKLDVEQVHFIYGEHDWMDPACGFAVRDRLMRDNARGGIAKGGRTHNVTVTLVSGAGHNVMVDDPSAFAHAVARSLAA